MYRTTISFGIWGSGHLATVFMLVLFMMYIGWDHDRGFYSLWEAISSLSMTLTSVYPVMLTFPTKKLTKTCDLQAKGLNSTC